MTNAQDSIFPSTWQPGLAHSRFLRQLLSARPDVVDWLHGHIDAPLNAGYMREFLSAQAVSDENSLKSALRRLRQRVMATLIVRDVGGAAPLSEVVETMTLLADLTTNYALDFLHRQLAAQFGEPLDK